MEHILVEKAERPGREIKIIENLCKNKNITGRIGTIDDKSCPKTTYILITFWVDIKKKIKDDYFDEMVSREFSKELSNIYKKDLKKILSNNLFFPFYNDNIYVYDFPSNLNYNKKKSFVSIELNLHTINCLNSTKKYPLKSKNETELFDRMLKVYNAIANSKLLRGKLNFSIHKIKD